MTMCKHKTTLSAGGAVANDRDLMKALTQRHSTKRSRAR